MHDPAFASVCINKLSRELNDVLAFGSNPDLKRIAELTVEIRTYANEIRSWAYEQGKPSVS